MPVMTLVVWGNMLLECLKCQKMSFLAISLFRLNLVWQTGLARQTGPVWQSKLVGQKRLVGQTWLVGQTEQVGNIEQTEKIVDIKVGTIEFYLIHHPDSKVDE